MARAKLNVLMYCVNEQDASVFAFVIEQHNTRRLHSGRGFRVHRAATIDEAMKHLQSTPIGYFSCVLVVGCGNSDAPGFAVDMEKAYPVVYVEWARRERPEDWLGRVDSACQVKQGPKVEDHEKARALRKIHCSA